MSRYLLFFSIACGLHLPVLGDGEENRSKDPADPLATMVFVTVGKGCYKMGADVPQVPQPDYFWDRVGYRKNLSEDERPRHEVCVDSFKIGKYEVTRAEWSAVFGDELPANGNVPQSNVSYSDALRFVSRLNERTDGKRRYRLPTEAEWEYACRAGGGADVSPLAGGAEGFAWFSSSKMSVQAVGQLRPNKLGIHDMLGNAWEWVVDEYRADAYKMHRLHNPVVGASSDSVSEERVIRGGSVRTERMQTRCAMRGHAPADFRSDVTGLRLVMEE